MDRVEKIEMTPDELAREREAAAVKAVRKVVEDELEPMINRLRSELRQTAITRDLIPEHVLLDWLDVSRDTLKRWGVPVHTQQGQTRFYDYNEVEGYIRNR